jgi:hypothetical protein
MHIADIAGSGANHDSSLYKSQKKYEADAKKREPKTAEEAAKQWQEAQKTPDHNTLLHVYKRAGVEPIKLAKYVAAPRAIHDTF